MNERTLVILKPSCVLRSLMGEVISRFEKKGLKLIGMKMIQLNDAILDIHYEHLKDKAFFQNLKNSMKASPVVVQCWTGKDATQVVRQMIGKTNGREANPGTIRGDFCMSMQENIVHASDSAESAQTELGRFFKEEEIFDYNWSNKSILYTEDEL